MEPLVSVILPVYGVEKYLEQCVNSVRNQTMREIEIILVDDGSPDNCPAMCDSYAAEDDRIKVIHQKNGGVTVARHTGLAAARAKWVMLTDSDDWMEMDAVEVLYKKTLEADCDLVIGSYYRSYVDVENYGAEKRTDATYWYHAPEYTKYLMATCLTAASRNPHMFPEDMRECHTIAAPWGKLYKRKFLEENNLRFPADMFFHDDMMFSLQMLHVAKKVCFVNHPTYHYRVRKESVVGAVGKNRHERIITAFERMGGFICECGEEEYLLPFLQICIALDILRMIQRYCECAESEADIAMYTGFLETLMEHEGIQEVIRQVQEEQIGNRAYRPMLRLLKEGKYEALLNKYWHVWQENEEKRKFV